MTSTETRQPHIPRRAHGLIGPSGLELFFFSRRRGTPTGAKHQTTLIGSSKAHTPALEGDAISVTTLDTCRLRASLRHACHGCSNAGFQVRSMHASFQAPTGEFRLEWPCRLNLPRKGGVCSICSVMVRVTTRLPTESPGSQMLWIRARSAGFRRRNCGGILNGNSGGTGDGVWKGWGKGGSGS